jgi:hypothetical protein
MRLSLADSLIHIGEQSESKLDFDFVRLLPLIKSIQAGARYPSITFFLYAELVLAILRQDNTQTVELLNQLCKQTPLLSDNSTPFRVLSFSDPVHLPYQHMYLKAMNTDATIDFYMGAPPDELAQQFHQRIQSAYELMRKAIPELADEFKTVVSDIVMVVGDDQAQDQFDGGSSYFLWGALFLNASTKQNDVVVLEALVHESAHMLLYACACDEALVFNPDDELYASPLRRDLRPMDGIYHASFVSARMHWAMQRLIKSGILDEADLRIAIEAREADSANFWQGYETIQKHGKLTQTGSAIMDATLDYMRQ